MRDGIEHGSNVAIVVALLVVGVMVLTGLSGSLRTVSAFEESCPDSDDAGTVVQQIAGSESNALSYLCGNASATPVYVGGSDVSSTTGFPLCTDTAVCTQSSLSIDATKGQLYCTMDSDLVGATTLKCITGGS